MFNWISQNSDTINVVLNVGMLIVWVAYLQLFLRSYRRTTRPKIVINRGGNSSLDSRCLISNMSSDPIYIESIRASIEAGGERWSCSVTSPLMRDNDPMPSDPKLLTHQGPLHGGAYFDIGSFRDLLHRVLDCQPGDLGDRIEELAHPGVVEVEVIADYGSEDLPVGAQRRFDINRENGIRLIPQRTDTRQIRGRFERLRIAHRLNGETG